MPGLSDGNEMTGPIQPHIRALDAVYPDDYAIDKVREAGFTTVYSTPARATSSAAPASPSSCAATPPARWPFPAANR